jgi:hypothetical protein
VRVLVPSASFAGAFVVRCDYVWDGARVHTRVFERMLLRVCAYASLHFACTCLCVYTRERHTVNSVEGVGRLVNAYPWQVEQCQSAAA